VCVGGCEWFAGLLSVLLAHHAARAPPHVQEAVAVGHVAVGHVAVGHVAVGHVAVGHVAVGHVASLGCECLARPLAMMREERL
jgi:hypothetical protein